MTRTPCPARELDKTRVETLNRSNETLTNTNVDGQESLGENNSL